MYEIYLDESNGSIREEDDIPTEDIETTLNIDNTNGDAKKVIDADESGIKVDADVDKSKLRSSPKKEKEPRDVKEVKDSKENKDGKDSKDSRSSKDSKSGGRDKQSHNLASPGGNNVWVSGLSSSTRAASLQALFKKYGKVLSAKIITNPRMPGSRAHGFITMETTEQAEKCIQHLNKTELDGKTITVSKNRPSESSSSSRHKSSSSSSSTKKDKQKDKDSKSKSGENKELVKDKSNDDNKKSDEKSSHGDDKKKKEKTGDKDKEKEKEKQKDRDKEKERCKSKEKDKEKERKKDDDKDQSKEKSEKDKDKDKGSDKDKSKEKDKKDESKDEIKIKKERSSKSLSRSRSRDRKKGSESPRKLFRRPIRRLAPAFLARRMNTRGRSTSSRPNPVLLRRIETERAQRRRERDREIQEAKRRRIELIRTQREVERKAQEERDRLEREMVKLRIERERLEREKAEILRLEREKARLERERLEREREELRRKQFQLPHRIDDSPRGRSGINKRPYDSRGDLRELDLHWDDRKRMSAPSPVTTSGRPFNGAVGSRLSDFDARHGHTSAYDNKGASYRRIKLDNPPSGGASRSEYDLRRESGRHGGSSGGHDRDDRRNAGGPSGGYYRDTSRITGSSRDRDRRGGGRDDWKNSHRRDRYFDKGLTSMGTSYSTGASYSGNNSGDWNSGERGSSNISKLSYQAGPSDSESRSRGAGLGSSIMTGSGNQLSDLYDSSNMPMAGIMSHGGIGSASGLASDERPYIHSVRRF